MNFAGFVWKSTQQIITLYIISLVVQEWDSVNYLNIDTETTQSIHQSTLYKILWFLLSFVFGIFAIALVFLFFVFCGCSYEFVNCYVSKKTVDVEDESFSGTVEESEDNDKPKSNYIIFLLILLGIACQPLYLLFYVLYGLMEFYRRFNCWFYYVDV